jgi:nucleoside permease NupC
MSQEEDDHKKNLEQERSTPQAEQPEQKDAEKQDQNKTTDEDNKPKKSLKSMAKNAKKIAKDVSSAVSLISFIQVIDIFFLLTIVLSGLKDIFDAGFIGTLLTPFLFIMTIMAMLVSGVKKFFGKKKLITLFLGNLLEMIPILNFLPLETVTTFLIYVFILQEKKETQSEQAEEQEEEN